MKPRVLAYGAALVGAAALVLFGDRTPDSQVAEAVERAPAPPVQVVAQQPSAAPAAPGDPAILRLIDRAALVGEGEEGANVFQNLDWNPPPVAPPPPPPPPAPSAPPLPFTYIGKAVSDGAWEVYLARSGSIYIVKNNMVIDGMYRVDAITPPTLKLTYLPLNQVQQLHIGVLE
ncbi:MAG: hypothetical protein ACXW2U_13295 [Telluria sp.]